MASCPNRSLKAWKDLETIQGEDIAAVIWDTFNGRPPEFFYLNKLEPGVTVKKSFDARSRFTEEENNAILDSIIYMLMETKDVDGFDLGKMIGNAKTRGAIPNHFLKQAYETIDGVEPSLEDAQKVYEAEIAYERSVRNNLPEAEQDKLFDAYENLQDELQVYIADTDARDAYLDIYEFWNSQSLTFGKSEKEIEVDKALKNIDVVGWRDLLAQRSKKFGLSIISSQEEIEFDSDEEILERIYTKSRLEEDPSKKLTGRMRELLARIPSSEVNLLGYKTYLPAEQVYKELAGTFSGLQNFPEMYAQMETLALHKPQYQAVADFMKTLDKKDAAAFTTVFAQSANEFLLVRVEKKTDAGDIVRIFNPNENKVERSIATTWKNGAVEGNIAKDKAIYSRDETNTLVINREKATNIAKNWSKVRQALAGQIEVLAPEGEVSEGVEALAEILWNMGIYYGDSEVKQETLDNLQKLMNTGIFVVDKGVRKKLTGRQAYNYIANKEDKSISKLVSGFVKLDTDGIGIKAIYPTAGRTVFESHPKVVRHLASFAPLFFDLKGDSFVNGKGKQIYPINLRHHMGQIFETLSTPSDDKNKMLDMYRGDKFYVPSENSNENNSLLLRLLESDDYSKEFRNIDLDALKDVTMPDGTVDYENFSASDSLRLRLINYVNLGKKDLFYASIPVQSDRKKFTVFPFPRTKNFEFTGKGTFGISGMSKKAIIKSYIVQDLMRIAHGRGILRNQKGEQDAPMPPRNLNETYKKNFRESRFMQFDGVLNENAIIEDAELTSMGDGFVMSYYIEKYILNPTELKQTDPKVFQEMSDLMDSMSDQALLYFEDQAQNIKQKVLDQNITLPVEVSSLGGIDAVISNFVFDDFIARNEISKFLRGSKAHSNDIQTFYKRMGQATTPGVELARASDLNIVGLDDPSGIENYGMPDTFTEATFEDIKLNLNAAQVARTEEKVEALRNGLKAAGVDPALADAIADQYKPGDVEGTDAQGAISIQFYRNIQQGRGEWTVEEEKAYEAYVKAPSGSKKFAYQEGFTPEGFEAGQEVPVYPIKPYYERNELVDGVVTTDSHKNSYHLLLEAETLNNPVKNNLRKRMEAVDEFKGLEQIGVANFVTAKKIKINKVNRLSENIEDFEAVEYNTVDSRGLRFPQDIPKKKASMTMLNRQVRANTITNIDTSEKSRYVLNAGLESERVISGKELLNIYHSAIERKTQVEFKQIEKELGIDKIKSLAKAGNAVEFNKAMTDFHVKLRDKIKEQNIERDLPTNYDAGLKIKLDAAGRPQFEIPLDFPVYFEKYQRIIFGMAINGAFKQKVPGMEAVQVAEIGGYAESGELNFYTVGEDNEGKGRIAHMEIMIREDIARKFGLEPGQDLNDLPEELRRIIGYRIPNQGKSSTIIAKIKRVLPANYAKSIVVPAELTKLTGSDFDIDKMFLMFPEVRQTDDGPVKVRPPYDAIVNGDLNIDKITDVSILNNIMLDVIEAVQANTAHVNETLAPLDESTLPRIVEALEKKFTDLQAPLEFASADIEIEMGIRNTIGRAMRGLWANFIAGHAVASYGNVNVNSNYEISLDGAEYSRIITKGGPEVSKYDRGIPINIIGSRYLSAAVDAAKKPYQYTLNDRTFTFPVEAYWISFTGDTKSLHDFLNVPIIREFTNTYYTKYGGKALHINDAIEDVIPSVFKEQYKDDKDKPATPMTREELENSTELSDVRQYELLLNFLKFREAGRNLTQLFKVITPGSMDGMNSIDSIKSYRSRQNQFDPINNEDQIFLNYEKTEESVAEQFIGENSVYPMQRAFSNLFLNIANMGSMIFPMTVSPALDQLDSKIMNLTGNNQMNPETHREIRRAAMLHLMTREGSPIREFFTDTHLINNYLDKENNLVVRLAKLKAQYPNLAKNLFIRKFVEDASNEAEDANVFLLNFDSSYQMTRFEKDAITAAAYRLLTRPEEVVGEDATLEERQTIINLAEDLLMNTLIVHGFKQTTGSYQDLIPVTFFTEGRFARYENPGERLGTTIDFFRKQLTTVYDSNSLDNFATEFIRQNYTIAPGGFNLLTSFRKKSTPNEIMLNEKDQRRAIKNGYATPFIVINNFKTGESFLYAAGHTSTGSSVTGKYVKINTLGVDGKLIEALNPTKSIINKDGFGLDEVVLTSDSTRVTTNAGNVASSAAEQNIICG